MSPRLLFLLCLVFNVINMTTFHTINRLCNIEKQFLGFAQTFKCYLYWTIAKRTKMIRFHTISSLYNKKEPFLVFARAFDYYLNLTSLILIQVLGTDVTITCLCKVKLHGITRATSNGIYQILKYSVITIYYR